MPAKCFEPLRVFSYKHRMPVATRCGFEAVDLCCGWTASVFRERSSTKLQGRPTSPEWSSILRTREFPRSSWTAKTAHAESSSFGQKVSRGFFKNKKTPRFLEGF